MHDVRALGVCQHASHVVEAAEALLHFPANTTGLGSLGLGIRERACSRIVCAPERTWTWCVCAMYL